jgi:flagellar hook-associated protein 3 FlgL
MSGISGPTFSPPATYGLLQQLIDTGNTVQSQLATLVTQASSGSVASTYAGLGAEAAVSLSLNQELAQNQTWLSNITSAQTNISLTQSAVGTLSKIASSLSAALDNITPNGIATLATQAQNDLKEVASILDTQNGGTYLFAGQDSANPPVPNPSGILSSGFYTQIQTAMAGLATNGAAATYATLLSIGSSNAPGTSPFSPALSPPPPGFNTTAEIGPGETVTTGLLASANTFALSSGPNTTGSAIRDLMTTLAAVGSMTNAMYGTPAFTGLLSALQATAQGAVNGLAGEASGLGAVQDVLTNAQNQLTSTDTALKTQLSSVQDVNLADVLSKLSSVQTALQASYKMIANFQNVSLVNYIS